MKSKLDWEKVQMENLIAKRGAETVTSESNRLGVVAVSCRYCGAALKNNGPRTEEKHIALCTGFDSVPIGNDDQAHSILEYLHRSNFPRCLLGKRLKTPNFIGRVREVLMSPPRVSVENVDGISKLIDIERLIRCENNRRRAQAVRKRKPRQKSRPPTRHK